MKVIPEHAQIQVMAALTACYRKHVLNDDSIGWAELSDQMSCALKEAMGDECFCFWLESVSSEQENKNPEIGENVAMGQIEQIRNAVQSGSSFINPKSLKFLWEFFEKNTVLWTEEEKEKWLSKSAISGGNKSN